MDRTYQSATVAGLLTQLKDRSGLSYAELGRRTYVSSSTLHRYCSGKTVPPDYQVVIRIAQECDATDDELAELLRRWRCAPAAKPEPVTEQMVEASRPVRRDRRSARLVAAGLAAVVVAVVTLTSAGAPDPDGGGLPAEQRITGPAWVRGPHPVDPAFFGVTMNSSTGVMPSFGVGGVRFWDSRTRWANLAPRRGEYDWSTLDRLVAGAQKARLPAVFTLGGTPGWAAPIAPKAAYDDGSRTGPPDDLTDWDAFVHALATRYRGRLDAYELWVVANDPRFYSGSVEVLVEMTARAARIIRAADSEATVVCPSMGRLWEEDGKDLLRRFAQLGGYQHCDVAGIKLHQRQASDPPETMIGLIADIYDTMHAAQVHPPLWNTGTSYDLPLQEQLGDRRAVDYAVRFYLVGLYGLDQNVRRMYFYNWGSPRVPIVLQAEGGAPTRAALAVERLQRWVDHADIHACGHGQAIGLPANTWQCQFTTGDGTPFTIRWTHTGTATTRAGPNDREVRHLDGTSTRLRAGGTVTVTETPVLISG